MDAGFVVHDAFFELKLVCMLAALLACVNPTRFNCKLTAILLVLMEQLLCDKCCENKNYSNDA
jgi:hypothetical protein